MTHDELLEELHYAKGANTPMNGRWLFHKILCEVVELHKPDESDFPDEWESCVECSGNGYVAMYPCETIRAIEKGLANAV
jgi:hypothetical protein